MNHEHLTWKVAATPSPDVVPPELEHWRRVLRSFDGRKPAAKVRKQEAQVVRGPWGRFGFRTEGYHPLAL